MNSLEGAEPRSAPPVPDYELIRLIGRGAYGEVWLARAITGVYRAVKIISRSKFREAGPFEREFRGLKEFAAISVQEPSQLAVLHVGRNEAAGFFFYVMELADDVHGRTEFSVDGYQPATLANRRDERRRIKASECMAIALSLTHALAALHARGLVHRDIKPANIVFVAGKPKLADIGLVAATDQAFTFVGTDGYIPPEGPGTPSADVYSLGRVLYQLTTGQDLSLFPRLPPGWEKDPDRQAFASLNQVVMRAADPARERRYRTAEAMLADLEAAAAGRKVRSGSGPGMGARRLAVAAAVLILAAVAAAWIRFGSAGRPKPDPAAALVARARHLSRMINFHRDDLVVAENYARQATDLDPNSAAAWGARAWVQAAYINRHWDVGAPRKRQAEELAQHALALDASQADALETLGMVLLSNHAAAAAEPVLRQATAAAPDDPLGYGLLATALATQGHPEQGFAVLQRATLRFPRDMLSCYNLATAEVFLFRTQREKKFAELAMANFHRISELEPMAYALIAQVRFDFESTGNLPDLRRALDALDRFPLEDRSDDRAVYFAAIGRLIDGRAAEVPAITGLTSRGYLDDAQVFQPVAWLDAMAEIAQGRPSGARIHWQAAEAVLREKLRNEADDAFKTRHYTVQMATTLAMLDRREEAAKLAAPAESAARDGLSDELAADLARYYLALGDIGRAVACAPAMHLHPYELKYDPWWSPVRASPVFARLFAERMADSP